MAPTTPYGDYSEGTSLHVQGRPRPLTQYHVWDKLGEEPLSEPGLVILPAQRPNKHLSQEWALGVGDVDANEAY